MSNSRIFLALVLVNAAGIALRYFGLETYFIFLGFRFHIGCILPFAVLLNKESLSELWESFKRPLLRKKVIPFFIFVFSLAAVLIVLYLLNQVKQGDPDYFYEFGISSIIDYPIYFAWNFPQLCMLFMTLSLISGSGNLSFLKVFAGIVLLFGFEFIPFNGDFLPFSAASFILAALTVSFFVTRLQNIYWFSFILFSSVWGIVLLFGSSSEILINIFFAREYSSWEGFFQTGRLYSSYIIPSFFLLLLVVTALYSLLNRKKIS